MIVQTINNSSPSYSNQRADLFPWMKGSSSAKKKNHTKCSYITYPKSTTVKTDFLSPVGVYKYKSNTMFCLEVEIVWSIYIRLRKNIFWSFSMFNLYIFRVGNYHSSLPYSITSFQVLIDEGKTTIKRIFFKKFLTGKKTDGADELQRTTCCCFLKDTHHRSDKSLS